MQIPEYENSEMSGRNLLRLKGAFLGYNSLDPPMELWPDAKWGNAKKIYFFFVYINFQHNFQWYCFLGFR